MITFMMFSAWLSCIHGGFLCFKHIASIIPSLLIIFVKDQNDTDQFYLNRYTNWVLNYMLWTIFMTAYFILSYFIYQLYLHYLQKISFSDMVLRFHYNSITSVMFKLLLWIAHKAWFYHQSIYTHLDQSRQRNPEIKYRKETDV